MNRVLIALWAMLLDFQSIRIIATVFARNVITIFTFFAGQSDFWTNVVASHVRAFQLRT